MRKQPERKTIVNAARILRRLSRMMFGSDEESTRIVVDGLDATVRDLAHECEDSPAVYHLVEDLICDDITNEADDRWHCPESYYEIGVQSYDRHIWESAHINGIDLDTIPEVFGVELGDRWEDIVDGMVEYHNLCDCEIDW